MWTQAAREAAALARQARDGGKQTADSVKGYPVAPHGLPPQQSVGTHDARGGRFGLSPILSAALGIGAGLASEIAKPAMSGGGGYGGGRRRGRR